MDLRQLRYFVAVVDTGSINKAAQRLFIRQPTLSEHVRRLELELGVALLVRSARGVAPTAPGRALFTKAKELISAVEELGQLVKRPSESKHTVVKVGFTPSLLELLLPLIAPIWRQHSLNIEPVELSAQAQITALLDGDLPYGFVRLSRPAAGLHEVCTIEDPWILVAHRSKGERRQRVASLADFEDDLLVSARDGPSPSVQEEIRTLCEAAGCLPRGFIEASTVQGALSVVRAQLAMAVLPATAALAADTDGLRVFPLREQSARSRIAFLAHGSTDRLEVIEATSHDFLVDISVQTKAAVRRKADQAVDSRTQEGVTPRSTAKRMPLAGKGFAQQSDFQA